MNKNINGNKQPVSASSLYPGHRVAGNAISRLLNVEDPERRQYAWLLLGAFLVCVAAFSGFGAFSRFAGMDGFEAGKVAERDVSAPREIIFIDEPATAVRVESEKRLVPPVFVIDDSVIKKSLADFDSFAAFFMASFDATRNSKDLVLQVQARFPAMGGAELYSRLAEYPAPAVAFSQARLILERLGKTGIVALPVTGLEHYNQQTIEVRRWSDGPLTYEQVSVDKLLTMRLVGRAAKDAAKAMKLNSTLAELAAELVLVFAGENTFFDPTQSEKRLANAASRVEPVMRRISRGEKILRKGFIITEGDMQQLAALRKSGVRFSFAYAVGGSFFLAYIFFGVLMIFAPRITGLTLDKTAFILVLLLGVLYFVIANGFSALLPRDIVRHLAAFMPTALLAMLMAIIFNERFALLYTLVLSVGLLLASGFEAYSFVSALVSGAVGAFLARKTEKRIDLVRGAAQLAFFQFIAGTALSSLSGNALVASLSGGFWQGVNGFLCGTLALGFLPVLEHALNAPTIFRLQELSDLNAPALKRLLSVAPGTYSHSVTVAHLAESACREIGASALLARVGAYYHDIGKIEQPEYFIENQSGYNKHDEINPRLSATVLRGHVKFGNERAETLGLPDNVKAIIAEHHGTSLISYFYSQAQKDDVETNPEDFRYPGPLPGSKESAVVMLADCVEAASRTLKKPNISKLEQFVKEMILAKSEGGQLARSELSFHDLELIKNTFVRILAGHFHSRIEYPKARELGK